MNGMEIKMSSHWFKRQIYNEECVTEKARDIDSNKLYVIFKAVQSLWMITKLRSMF